MVDLDLARLLSRILTLYYEAGHSQAEIAGMLGLSTPKVNRLLQQARREGMVEIRLHVPYENLFGLERRLMALAPLHDALVIPVYGGGEEALLKAAGAAAARLLETKLRDGSVLCTGGGRALHRLVEALKPASRREVTVVPALGGVQGRFATDVNRLAAEAAARLGGQALQLLAPALVDSDAEQQALFALRPIRDVLAVARRANVLVMGIGTLEPHASYFDFAGLDTQKRPLARGGVGEVLAHVIDAAGRPCRSEHTYRVIGLALDEIRAVPVRVGVAVAAHKAPAIAAALRAGYLTALVTDEQTAKEVIRILESV